MDNSFTSLIESATSILVLLPQKPNFDQVAAGLSFYLSIFDRKSTTISCGSPMMVGFNRIIGINKITSEVGNKNLTLKFIGYEASNIEKVSYDIINGEFNLTVVPKVGFTAPGKEQIEVGFSGLSADLVVLIGGMTDEDFPILASSELTVSKIVHIGTHSFNSTREVLSFAKPGAATSELIANLIKETGGSIDPDIATNLVMGIEEGSSNFSGAEVTPDTFETFAYLLRNGGKRQSRTKLSPMGFPQGSIPTQPLNMPIARPVEVNSDPMLEKVEVKEEVDIENAPDDWLKPKVFQGTNTPVTQPDSFSENKG